VGRLAGGGIFVVVMQLLLLLLLAIGAAGSMAVMDASPTGVYYVIF
jgi:hypothetical protein